MMLSSSSLNVSALVTISPYNSMTEVASRAILLVYVPYVRNDDFEEQFLINADLPTSTTAAEIFFWNGHIL